MLAQFLATRLLIRGMPKVYHAAINSFRLLFRSHNEIPLVTPPMPVISRATPRLNVYDCIRSFSYRVWPQADLRDAFTGSRGGPTEANDDGCYHDFLVSGSGANHIDVIVIALDIKRNFFASFLALMPMLSLDVSYILRL